MIVETSEVSPNLSSNSKGHVLRGEKIEVLFRVCQSPVLRKRDNATFIGLAVEKLGCSNTSFTGTDSIHDNRSVGVYQPVVGDKKQVTVRVVGWFVQDL
jgi:hypothetical protein